MNTNNLDFFFTLRKYFLLSSKVIGIIFCFYYIKHSANYTITWPLLNLFMPESVTSFLSNLGTIILIIPLTILITSLLLPQNNILHVTSCLFGVMGILLTLIKNVVLNKPIGDVTSFKFMTVQKVLNLPEKREIFQQEFIRIVNENYISMLKTYDYLMSKLTADYFINYDVTLNNLKIQSQIKQYASEVIINLTKELAISNAPTHNTYPSLIKPLIIIAGSVLVLWLINKYFFNDSSLDLQEKHVDITKTVTELAKDTTTVVKDVAANTNILSDSISTVATESIKLNTRLDIISSKLNEINQTMGLEYSILLHAIDKINEFEGKFAILNKK